MEIADVQTVQSAMRVLLRTLHGHGRLGEMGQHEGTKTRCRSASNLGSSKACIAYI